MSFTIDDIADLTISVEHNRLDSTGEFDISYYEDYLKENVEIIGKLIVDVRGQVNLIKDEAIKNRVLNWMRMLAKAYEKSKNQQPKEDYENSSRFKNGSNIGFFQNHKYAIFVEKNLQDTSTSYSEIVSFMNNIYGNSKIAYKKGLSDNGVLWNIFITTKKACAKLGIHCPDSAYLYRVFATDPYNEKTANIIDYEVRIDEENSLDEEIVIDTLPYTVTLPYFTTEGVKKYEMSIPNPKACIWYNKSYIDRIESENNISNMIVEERKQPRMREPYESDAEYNKYLEDFYSSGGSTKK